jgi:prepilin-type N-terminal cleavage/methylation domain-containing protein
MIRLPNKTNSGFTLIEVMLVIAIIGLLVSVVMSNLRDARESARDTAITQQVRTMTNIFEYERNKVGTYQNYDIGIIGNNGLTDTCADKNFQGEFEAKLLELCQGIEDQQRGFESNSTIIISVDGAMQNGNHFSIMTQLNNGDWYCVGSNGGTYNGPPNPGNGNWMGPGCYANP